MVNEFQTLLQATIHHLEDLSREGTKYLTMDPALLSVLTQKTGAKPKAPVASRPRSIGWTSVSKKAGEFGTARSGFLNPVDRNTRAAVDSHRRPSLDR